MTSSVPRQHVDLRVARPTQCDERTMLIAFLRWHRLTLEHKCADLAPQELARRSVNRSALSLLGLVRHCAEGEQFWFRHVMAGQDPQPLFPTVGPGEAFDVDGADEAMVADAWQVWRAEVAFAEDLVARARWPQPS